MHVRLHARLLLALVMLAALVLPAGAHGAVPQPAPGTHVEGPVASPVLQSPSLPLAPAPGTHLVGTKPKRRTAATSPTATATPSGLADTTWYGMSDAGSDFLSAYSNCGFQALTNTGCPSTGHKGPLSLQRFFVPYDALSYWNTSTGKCAPSPAYTTGGNGKPAGYDWNLLITQLKDAKADNLAPLIAVSNGTGIGTSSEPVPAVPEPFYGIPGKPYAGLTTAGQDYSCGVQSLLYNLESGSNNNQPWIYPWEYEAWNEPDGANQGNSNNGGYNHSLPNACTNSSQDCGPIPSGSNYNQNGYLCGNQYVPVNSTQDQCGPLEAAGLWYLMQNAQNSLDVPTSQGGPGLVDVPVDAGTLSQAQALTYFNAYYNQLSTTLNSGPGSFSVHDYDDPTGAVGTANIQAFVNDLSNLSTPGCAGGAGSCNPNVSVTEAAVQLDSDLQTSADRNAAPACPDPTNESLISGKDANGNPILPNEPIRSVGNCDDGNAAMQRNGANVWENISNVVAGSPATSFVSVGELFWYTYQLPNTTHNFDSALVDASGRARASYCVIYGAGCNVTGNPSDYLDGYFNQQTQSWVGVG